jgi:NAD+ synthase (glutamine-hydrolysing)
MPVIINLNKIRSFRLANKSFQKESHGVSQIPRVYIDKYIANNDDEYNLDGPEHKLEIQRLRGIYEYPHATFEPSLWLWECLKKSKKNGFHIPLSGGKNSAAVALIVYNMCQIIHRHIVDESSEEVLFDLRKILKDNEYYPNS